MASVLDLVKHYQHAIEKYTNDQQRVLKSIDKLFNLDVTVQHLQETGVGRTVNALRKEPGSVGQAARALVCKWKLMVAAEESDQEGDHATDSKTYNGHDNGRDSDDSAKKESRSKDYQHETSDSRVKTEYKQENGHHSGTKRKYHSSEEEVPEVKKSKSSSSDNSYQQKSNIQIKKERTESESDYTDRSHSRNSDSESSEISEEEQDKNEIKLKIKQEPPDHHKSKHSSSDKNYIDHKKESSSSKSINESDKHTKNRHKSESVEKTSSDKSSSKDKSHSSHKHKSSKENESSVEKSHKSDHRSSEKSKQKEESSSSKHKDSSDKHKSSKSDSNSEKHNSNNTEKHSSKSDKGKSSHSHKSDKDKNKSSSGKETSLEKHKSKESDASSSKERHSSSSKERSKDRSNSSKEKSELSHKSDKKHSSSDKKSRHSENKHKSERKDGENYDMKTKHKPSLSSSLSQTSKSSSSKSKEDIPKKKSNDNGADSDEGINCESGASFAEALGMISPTKPKKKTKVPLKDVVSPNLSNSEDLSPAVLLAPTAKLAPLPAIEISALPEISPNYKPRPPPKLLPHFTDDEAMSAVISSKNQRTKVYSGNKVIGKIPSLYEMCVQVLQEHIDALEYTGGVPYDILKPVVDRATPQQLFMLEHYNPYLMEDTDHLWHKFCEKHFRNKQRQEMETWREMYMRCQEEQEHRLKSLTANIRIAQEKAKAPIKQTKMAYVDTVVKPPRNIARKQAMHGTAHAAAASPAARVASLAAAPNVLRGSARPSPAAPAIFAPHRPKKAPLMQKALQFMRGRKR